MGFLAPAIPWIIKGASAVGGAIASKKAQKSAAKLSPQEGGGVQGQQRAASNLAEQGQDLNRIGLPGLQKTSSYYDTLLRGDRAAMSQATAGSRASLTDLYRGATRNLEHSGVTGAARDVATAELNRDRAAKIAGLTTGVQPAAAGALTDLSTGATSQAAANYGAAGTLWGGLNQSGFENRKYARGEGERTGAQVGGLVFDVLNGISNRKKTNPDMQSYPGADSH